MTVHRNGHSDGIAKRIRLHVPADARLSRSLIAADAAAMYAEEDVAESERRALKGEDGPSIAFLAAYGAAYAGASAMLHMLGYEAEDVSRVLDEIDTSIFMEMGRDVLETWAHLHILGDALDGSPDVG